MQSEGDLESVWRALASPIRRGILDLLRDGPLTTGAIAAAFPDISRYAVMQHLAVLVEGNLVVHQKAGRTRLNYLNPIPIQQIYHRWVRRYQAPWAEALVSIKGALEGKRKKPATRGRARSKRPRSSR